MIWKNINLVFSVLFTGFSAYSIVVGDISHATYFAVLMLYFKYTSDQEK